MDTTLPVAVPEFSSAPPVNGARVTAWLLSFSDKNRQTAEAEMLQFWNQVEIADQEYNSSKLRVVANASTAKQTKREFIVPEAANQVDIVQANFKDNYAKNGEPFQAMAQGGESQEKADVTKQVMLNAMDKAKCQREDDLMMQHYIMYPGAFQKAYIETCDDVEHERVSIPDDPFALAELEMKAAGMGATVRRIGPADTSPDGLYTSILYELAIPKKRRKIGYRTIDPRNIALGNVYDFYRTGNIQNQPHIHEFNYWTLEQIENYSNFKNLDKIGQANAGAERHPNTAGQDTSTANASVPSANYPLYRITDGWFQPPFKRALDAGEFTIDELEAHAAEFEYQITDAVVFDEFGEVVKTVNQKWCITHKDNEVLLACYPNYKRRKQEYPYRGRSFYVGGQSYLQRILPACQQIAALRNLHMQNIKTKVKQPIILDANSAVQESDLKKLHDEDGAVIMAEIGSRPIEQQIIFYGQMVDDMTASAMAGIGLLQNDIASFGTPPIMQGNGKADTATQDAINNSRGQQKLNNPFNRMVNDICVPVWEDLLDLIAANYTEPEYIQVAGEDGIAMARTKWVTPDQITDRIKIIPNAAFDFADRNAKAQQLIAMLNIVIGSGLVGPETAMKMLGGIYEYMGFSRQEINEWTNNKGLGTDPNEEIRVMVENPHQMITVRPDDPHQICVLLGMQALETAPQLATQYNFQQYMQMHQIYMEMMAQQAAMAAAQNAPPGGKSKGPPKQPAPESPTTQEGTEARQPGQLNSAPDGGLNALGMTGQGGLAAMGGQLPNSISSMVG